MDETPEHLKLIDIAAKAIYEKAMSNRIVGELNDFLKPPEWEKMNARMKHYWRKLAKAAINALENGNG